jgi:serine/threonine protein kinase
MVPDTRSILDETPTPLRNDTRRPSGEESLNGPSCHSASLSEQGPHLPHRAIIESITSTRFIDDTHNNESSSGVPTTPLEANVLVHVNVPVSTHAHSPDITNVSAPNQALSKPKLTLSAFRRPEQTVRLTTSDPHCLCESVYDLHTPGCSGVLGHGAFSTVRLARRRRDNVKVAVKTIAKHEALRSRRLRPVGTTDDQNHARRRYLEEWEILRRMQNHPYVVNLLDVYETHEEIQIVTEYCPGGELFDAIQKRRSRAHALRRTQYTEAQAATITSQILRALADLHDHGIVHRDVKPENILLTKDEQDDDDQAVHVKLCDFGMARSLLWEPDTYGDDSPLTPARSRAYSMIGSNYYVAPEVNYGNCYDTAVDVYSLGVTLYILLCGFPPVFSGSESDAAVLFPSMYWKDVSDSAKDLVRQMLNSEPGTRVTAKQAERHPWIVHNKQASRSSPPRRPLLPSKGSNTGNTSTHSFQQPGTVAQVNLDLVRSRLYLSMGQMLESPPRKRLEVMVDATSPPASGHKRSRMTRRTSTCLMALADLYRGVASPSKPAVTSPDKRSPAESIPPKDIPDPYKVATALSF